MNKEKPQFESFWKKEKNSNKEFKVDPEKTNSLAHEVEEAFSRNDFDTALEKLKELKRISSPEPLREEGAEFQEAREILGKDLIGPEEIKKVFNIELSPEEIEKVKDIPFSREELEKAKELGMMLVLRVDHDRGGSPLTISRLKEMFNGGDTLGAPGKKKDKIFYSKLGEGWYNNEDFATKETAHLGWGLVAKSVLPETLNKNHEDQWKEVEKWAKKNSVDVKTLRRRTPIEVIYDEIAYYGANKESLLEETYDWTSARSSGGGLVYVGSFDSDGLDVNGVGPDFSDSNLGVCPSR
ncbi:MAG: hypothetical protein M1334_00125 [Patescibacteria group bacterium]|nr:hypothetical protein [Patescibacteria group bacterium]